MAKLNIYIFGRGLNDPFPVMTVTDASSSSEIRSKLPHVTARLDLPTNVRLTLASDSASVYTPELCHSHTDADADANDIT